MWGCAVKMQHLKIGQRYIHHPKQKHDVEIFFKNDRDLAIVYLLI
jgi:hypothetical protein